MTVAAGVIGCVCCCLGPDGVHAYSCAAKLTGALGFLRFCGACGFVVGLVSAQATRLLRAVCRSFFL